MELFLIIAGSVVFLAIVVFGVIGYFKSKKLFAEFLETTTGKLPLKKAEILELDIEELKEGAKYVITFADSGTETTHVAYGDNIKLVYDLKKNEKPYIKYRYLDKAVPFPRVRGWEVGRGYYNIELHIEK